jgi:hypothetical protein
MGDYLFTICGSRRKTTTFFGRSRLARFAERLPQVHVEVIDKHTCKSLGAMPAILAKKKFT